ncbi:MAG: TRAP transporter small permease [Treponemataceae bacterium]
MRKIFTSFDKVVGHIEEAVSVTALVVISLLVITQVFFRYILNSGILWVDEVVTILMVTMVMFGSPAVTRRLLHTELLVFVNKMPNPIRRSVRALTSIIGLSFLGLFLYSATKYALNAHGMVTTVLRIPIQYVYSIMPVGAALAIYEYLKKMPAAFKETEGRGKA